jgi:nitrogen regulatory protein PII
LAVSESCWEEPPYWLLPGSGCCELVCDAEDFETFVNTILENAHTGSSGDGLIFVSDVKEAIKIRTKKRSTKIAGL